MQYFNFKLILLAVLVSLISCKDEEKIEKTALRPVAYQKVQFIGGEAIRIFSGTARTDKIINLSFRNKGIITEFNLKLGKKVKKGQLLAKLDNVQSRLNYESAISSLNSAASQMNTAKLSLNRVRLLFEKGSASLSDYEAARNSHRTAVASHESAKRSVAIQQEQIRYGYLYAPENGIISGVNVEIDENVNSGQSIAVLNAGTDMEISLGLPENVINKVKQNMKVDATFSSLPNKTFSGKVTEVSPSANQDSSTYPVSIRITNPSEEIKSGMAANVTFYFKNQENVKKALVVPANAVGEDDKGNFVFLLENTENGSVKVKRQTITVGSLSSEGFEVKEGLSHGQNIATAGLQTLLDGQEVKLIDAIER